MIARDLMNSEFPYYVTADVDAAYGARLLSRCQAGAIQVVDEHLSPIGIVTRSNFEDGAGETARLPPQQAAPPAPGSFGGWPEDTSPGVDDIHTRSIWDHRNVMLRTDAGEMPYNDLEFYVFVRGFAPLAERRDCAGRRRRSGDQRRCGAALLRRGSRRGLPPPPCSARRPGRGSRAPRRAPPGT